MIDTRLIPKPENNTKVIKDWGNTQDIINSILRVDKNYRSERFDKFALQFSGKGGLKKLWDFVKYQIKYKKDDFDKSIQLTPPALWKKRSGDCKSKTLFVNAVLRGLNIPYIIRFTNYDGLKKNIKHVYTVAIVDGKELPIDTVYGVFGKEKKPVKKIDYPMAEIVEISGLNTKNATLSKKELKYLYSNKTNQRSIAKIEEIRQRQQYVKPQEPIPFYKITEAEATLRIVKNELELIKSLRPDRSKIADKGLKLIHKALKGDFSCTGEIPPDLAGTYYKIKMAEKQQHLSAMDFGGNQEKIKFLKRIRKEEQETSRINGQFPQSVCLEGGLWTPRKLDLQKMENDPKPYAQFLQNDFFPIHTMETDRLGWKGVCTGWPDQYTQGQWNPDTNTVNPILSGPINNNVAWGGSNVEPTIPSPTGESGGTNFFAFANTVDGYIDNQISDYSYGNYGSPFIVGGGFYSDIPMPNIGNMTQAQWTNFANNHLYPLYYGQVATYTYGHKSKYAKTYFQNRDRFDDSLRKAIQLGYLIPNGNYGWYSFHVNSQTNFDLALDVLNQGSGILSDQVNDVYRSDNSLNGAGSMGSGLFYTFLNSSNRQVNDYPTQVQIKGNTQNQFLDATNFFSSISRSNVQGMSRNGVLYNSGGVQPEYMLENALALSLGEIEPAQINCAGVCAVATIVVAICAMIASVTSVIVDAVLRGQMMELEAKKIDSMSSDNANFPPSSQGNFPNNEDWQLNLPDDDDNDDDDDKKKKILMIGAGVLGAVLLLGDED